MLLASILSIERLPFSFIRPSGLASLLHPLLAQRSAARWVTISRPLSRYSSLAVAVGPTFATGLLVLAPCLCHLVQFRTDHSQSASSLSSFLCRPSSLDEPPRCVPALFTPRPGAPAFAFGQACEWQTSSSFMANLSTTPLVPTFHRARPRSSCLPLTSHNREKTSRLLFSPSSFIAYSQAHLQPGFQH